MGVAHKIFTIEEAVDTWVEGMKSFSNYRCNITINMVFK